MRARRQTRMCKYMYIYYFIRRQLLGKCGRRSKNLDNISHIEVLAATYRFSVKFRFNTIWLVNVCSSHIEYYIHAPVLFCLSVRSKGTTRVCVRKPLLCCHPVLFVCLQRSVGQLVKIYSVFVCGFQSKRKFLLI